MAERPKWPEDLPPILEWEERPGDINLAIEDFPDQLTVEELAHDVYWFTESGYFVFYPQERGFPSDLEKEFERHGLDLRSGSAYFYKHPRKMLKNDFIQVSPSDDVPEPLRIASLGTMYVRLTVTMAPSRRKERDIAEAAMATAKMIERPDPVIEAKPGAFGFSVDLFAAAAWIKRKLRQGE